MFSSLKKDNLIGGGSCFCPMASEARSRGAGAKERIRQKDGLSDNHRRKSLRLSREGDEKLWSSDDIK